VFPVMVNFRYLVVAVAKVIVAVLALTAASKT
jgi:hypothetical protein